MLTFWDHIPGFCSWYCVVVLLHRKRHNLHNISMANVLCAFVSVICMQGMFTQSYFVDRFSCSTRRKLGSNLSRNLTIFNRKIEVKSRGLKW